MKIISSYSDWELLVNSVICIASCTRDLHHISLAHARKRKTTDLVQKNCFAATAISPATNLVHIWARRQKIADSWVNFPQQKSAAFRLRVKVIEMYVSFDAIIAGYFLEKTVVQFPPLPFSLGVPLPFKQTLRHSCQLLDLCEADFCIMFLLDSR